VNSHRDKNKLSEVSRGQIGNSLISYCVGESIELEDYQKVDVEDLNRHWLVQPQPDDGWLEFQVAGDVKRFVPLHPQRREYREENF